MLSMNFGAFWLAVGLVAAAPGGPGADARADRAVLLQQYEEARAHAGRGADAQVGLALWCEAHGMDIERVEHLALALLYDPTNVTARGLMGLVSYRGRWERPESVSKCVLTDAAASRALAAYNARRAHTPDSVDAQWKLALWCEENGMKAEALAHLAAVVRLDPARAAAWKRLGCKKVSGRWVSEEQLAAERAEAEVQRAADRRWKPLLAKWRTWLADRDSTRRQAAETSFSALADPRAVPAVWAEFVAGKRPDHARAVQLLGQIDAAPSSRGLAALAVFDANAHVRRTAAEILNRRDPREFANLLIALIRDPIRYRVQPVWGPGSPGALFIEGQSVNVLRNYAAPELPLQARTFASSIPFDPFGDLNLPGAWAETLAPANTSGAIVALPVPGPNGGAGVLPLDMVARLRDYQIGLNLIEVQKAAAASREQLADDISRLDAANRQIDESNAHVTSILRQTTGADLPADRAAWSAWYFHQIGYMPPGRPSRTNATVVTDASPYLPVLNPTTSQPIVLGASHSCFGAGTPVRTLAGPRPIETLKAGDLVLAQDAGTGALSYRPVLAALHNPPSPTFVVKVSGDAIVSSPFHRFWVVGGRWVMARDLRAGDRLRLLGGPARVEAVTEGPTQPVFNLEVADVHDFFAGSSAALVHDVVLPDTHFVPFDVAALTTAASRRETILSGEGRTGRTGP
jgi:hypothetical protein